MRLCNDEFCTEPKNRVLELYGRVVLLMSVVEKVVGEEMNARI